MTFLKIGEGQFRLSVLTNTGFKPDRQEIVVALSAKSAAAGKFLLQVAWNHNVQE